MLLLQEELEKVNPCKEIVLFLSQRTFTKRSDVKMFCLTLMKFVQLALVCYIVQTYN